MRYSKIKTLGTGYCYYHSPAALASKFAVMAEELFVSYRSLVKFWGYVLSYFRRQVRAYKRELTLGILCNSGV